jgi:hypothetical protein
MNRRVKYIKTFKVVAIIGLLFTALSLPTTSLRVPSPSGRMTVLIKRPGFFAEFIPRMPPPPIRVELIDNRNSKHILIHELPTGGLVGDGSIPLDVLWSANEQNIFLIYRGELMTLWGKSFRIEQEPFSAHLTEEDRWVRQGLLEKLKSGSIEEKQYAKELLKRFEP